MITTVQWGCYPREQQFSWNEYYVKRGPSLSNGDSCASFDKWCWDKCSAGLGDPQAVVAEPGPSPPDPGSLPLDWEAPAQRSARQCRPRSQPPGRSGDSQLPGTSCTKKTIHSSFSPSSHKPEFRLAGGKPAVAVRRGQQPGAWQSDQREGAWVPGPRRGWWSRPCPARGPRQPWAII